MNIQAYLNRIKNGEKVESIISETIAKAKTNNSNYNVFTNFTEKRALERARNIDLKIKNGEKVGSLAGVPFASKDNLLSFGANTTASSHMLEQFDSPLQATVIERLEAEGAILIGKTNLDSFAHGASTENSFFGVTKNAIDPSRVAGGSSGGSAVAVALGIVPFALGSDTGGSIRQPASYNGVFGYKPTYGLVSRFGAVAMGSSTDCVGCLASNLADVDLVINIMSGFDKNDMTTYNSDYRLQSKIKQPKLAIPKQFMIDGLDKVTRTNINKIVSQLKTDGFTIEEIDFPELKYALAIYYIVISAEVASNLGRYDGVRYPYSATNQKDLADLYLQTRSDGFEMENKRRIMIGNFVLSSGYYDAYYLKAQKVRTLLINRFNYFFKKYDFIIGPVTPEVAFKIGENSDDPLKMYLADILTTPASLAGLPAISLPIETNDMPVGLQIIGRRDQDRAIIDFSQKIKGVKSGN